MLKLVPLLLLSAYVFRCSSLPSKRLKSFAGEMQASNGEKLDKETIAETQEFSKNQTLAFRSWWKESVADYDNRIRPYFGVKPLKIKLGLTLLAISSISESTMDWTVEMYFHEYWQDPRLTFDIGVFNNKMMLTLPQEAQEILWIPDTSFINALRCVVPKPGSVSHLALLRVNQNGEMFSARRISVTAGCNMDLTMYPFDSQTCTLVLSSFGYTLDDVFYDWKKRANSIDLNSIQLPDFKAISMNARVINQTYVAGNYSVPQLCIVFNRRSGFCFLQLFIPATAVVGASWISLWLENETQFADIVSIILAIIFLSYSYNTVMPKVSYIKAMDIYLGACFIFAFLSLAKLAVVKYMRKKVSKRANRSTFNMFTSDFHLNDRDNSLDALNVDQRRKSLAPMMRRQSHLSEHDRYWVCMKVFHIGSQLVLPLAFGGFGVFYFFIYPYINLESNKCF